MATPKRSYSPMLQCTGSLPLLPCPPLRSLLCFELCFYGGAPGPLNSPWEGREEPAPSASCCSPRSPWAPCLRGGVRPPRLERPSGRPLGSRGRWRSFPPTDPAPPPSRPRRVCARCRMAPSLLPLLDPTPRGRPRRTWPPHHPRRVHRLEERRKGVTLPRHHPRRTRRLEEGGVVRPGRRAKLQMTIPGASTGPFAR